MRVTRDQRLSPVSRMVRATLTGRVGDRVLTAGGLGHDRMRGFDTSRRRPSSTLARKQATLRRHVQPCSLTRASSREICFRYSGETSWLALGRSSGRAPAREEELGMAKRKEVLPARKPRDRTRDDDSLLLRSAESLGRVIGALQRQLDGATGRLTDQSQ